LSPSVAVVGTLPKSFIPLPFRKQVKSPSFFCLPIVLSVKTTRLQSGEMVVSIT